MLIFCEIMNMRTEEFYKYNFMIFFLEVEITMCTSMHALLAIADYTHMSKT